MNIALAIIVFLVFDFIGDFLLQSRWVATNKSKDDEALCIHFIYIVATSFLAFWIVGAGFWKSIPIALGYAIVHCIQDRYLWTLYKEIRLDKGLDFKYYKDKLFYTFIGLDRLLHVSLGVAMVSCVLRG